MKKYISGFLICLLLITQTIRIDFLVNNVEAHAENYHPIVSLIVDAETYQSLRTEVSRYAEDIQRSLGNARTVIFVVDAGTHPAQIAGHNEELYYMGDGGPGQSYLVGTVLIGNIPIPTVFAGGQAFPSLYPYVDFDDKTFVYHPGSHRYELASTQNRSADMVDIWHGVINPSIGREWNANEDIASIRDFLHKTHEFYTKQGVFSSEREQTPPRVLYYDGFTESRSLNPKKILQYTLRMENAERLAYRRYSQEFLQMINQRLANFDVQHRLPEEQEFLDQYGSDQNNSGLSEDTIENMPAVHTIPVVNALLGEFHDIPNKKVLGEHLSAVRNAGRYNSGSTVRVDIPSVNMSILDQGARDTIRSANDSIETYIDELIRERKIARKIPVYETLQAGFGDEWQRWYTNYYFGMPWSQVETANLCHIGRGWTGGVIVEANTAFDIRATQEHSDRIRRDMEDFQLPCMQNGQIETRSYWGYNSVLRMVRSGGAGGQNANTSPSEYRNFPAIPVFRGMTQPIFSLWGMRESDRLGPPSVMHCIDDEIQYTLPNPNGGYPSEVWQYQVSPTRFTCISQVSPIFTGTIINPQYGEYQNDPASRVIPLLPQDFFEEMDRYQMAPCLVGKIILDNETVRERAEQCQDADDRSQSVLRDIRYHTIDGILYHTSPTDEEIQAARENGMTYSLPIDIDRSIEFITPKGNHAIIQYPNLFRAPAHTVEDMRSWIDEYMRTQWQAILNRERDTYLSPGHTDIVRRHLDAEIMAEDMPHWGSILSDALLAEVIRSKQWLDPSIDRRHQDVVERMLSYSGIKPGDTLYNRPPELIETPRADYEIAYLGLSRLESRLSADGSGSDAEGDMTGANGHDAFLDQYQRLIGILQWLRISEWAWSFGAADGWIDVDQYEGRMGWDRSGWDTQCWPIDGVMIWQWPQAIICWMQKELPPKVFPSHQCSVGVLSSGESILDIISPPQGSTSYEQREWYRETQVSTDTTRRILWPHDSTTLRASIIREHPDGWMRRVYPDGEVSATLQIASVTAANSTIPPDRYHEYFSVSPEGESIVSNWSAQFVFQSRGQPVEVRGNIVYTLHLDDNSIIILESEPIHLIVGETRLDVSLEKWGNPVHNVEYSESEPVLLIVKNVESEVQNFTVRLIDEITSRQLLSQTVPSGQYTLPQIITENPGTYRVIVETESQSGEMVFSVRAGTLDHVRLLPASSSLIRGGETVVMLSLEDRYGHTIAPNLHHVKLTIEWGVFLNTYGETVETLELDVMQSFTSFTVRSLSDEDIRIRAELEWGIDATESIRVVSSAEVRFALNAPSGEIRAGGSMIPIQIHVLDQDGAPLSWFSSVASWSLLPAAGKLNMQTIPIINGTSSWEVFYIPGSVVGTHNLTLTIPGVGTNHIPLTIQSSDPLYIDHAIQEGNIVFTARDRYGNRTHYSGSGVMRRGNDAEQSVVFSDGIYSHPYQSGYYRLHLPEIDEMQITYEDNDGMHEIRGIGEYRVYIPETERRFDFYPDYNARYTVLVGGEFLREAEDILYDQTSGASQSLAVSTLLDTPYTRESLISLFPDGSYRMGESDEMLLQETLTLEQWYPVIHLSDDLQRQDIARWIYRMSNAQMVICEASGACEWEGNRIAAKLTHEDHEFAWKSRGDGLYLERSNRVMFSINAEGRIEHQAGVTLAPVSDSQTRGLAIRILYQGWEVWRVYIQMNGETSVQMSDDIWTWDVRNALMMSVSRFSVLPFTDRSGIHGYRIEATSPLSGQMLDSVKNAPLDDEAFGAIDVTPGVGWKDNNRLLLSYAAGDTVGEASKWFHTYTFVNLGDPGTHVTQGRPGTQIDGIDRTIGTQIASSQEASLLDFRRADMNGDTIEDIITFSSDGYIRLLLNLQGRFHDRGKIAYIADLEGIKIRIADFQGDGYGDILGVNTDGALILISNIQGRFSRQTLRVSDGVPPEYVSQIETYDMDADGKHDIVYLTSAWELSILYGTDTAGMFMQKILDSNLTVTLNNEIIRTGWAFFGSNVTQIEGVLGVNPNALEGDPYTQNSLPDTMIQAEVYYQHTDFSFPPDADMMNPDEAQTIIGNELIDPDSDFSHYFASGATASGTVIRPGNGNSGRIRTFIRSQYAEIVDVDIQKTHRTISGAALLPGGTVEGVITLKNTGNTPIIGAEYLDSLLPFFSDADTEKYTVEIDGTSSEKTMESLTIWDYDFLFRIGDIAPGSVAVIRFPLKVLPISYGELVVGDLERSRAWHDDYGDVALRTSTTCGADRMEWLSLDRRDYMAWVGRSLQASYADALPDSVGDALEDVNNNGIPDSIENMSHSDREGAYQGLVGDSERQRNLVRMERRGNTFDIDFDHDTTARVEGMMDDIFNGLSCGFWGWSCMSFPINWAPLAPGNDPVVFGMPIGDGFRVGEGIPIFSSLTWMNAGPYCIPSVWPISPLSQGCVGLGAGGYLGIDNPTNVIRIFVTPTLTLGMGAAICLGWPASSMGWQPWPGLFPFVQWGNCIVMAKPMPICRGDGSAQDGDVRYFAGSYAGWSSGGGWGTWGGSWGQAGGLGVEMDTWNAASCQIRIGWEISGTFSPEENRRLEADIIAYMRQPNPSQIPGLSVRLSERGVSSLNGWPLVRIRGGSGWGTELDISLVGTNNIADTRLVNVGNRRIAAFPDFLMDWLTRQVEEFVNAFFTPPNLTIIPPTDFGQNMKIDRSYSDFLEQLDRISVAWNRRDMTTQMFESPRELFWDQGTPVVANGLNAIRSAYTFIAKLPFITLDQRRIPLNIPWITANELNQYERQIYEYTQTIDRTLASWCVSNPTPECLAQKASLADGAFRSSLRQNLQRIQEYRNFPEKLQKYVNWKQHYLYQIVCNIEKLQEMIGGWIYTNGVRFRKWAELFVLIKAIASSWQPLIDIFANMNAQCGVCRNERYNAQYWKFRLLSMLLPNIPVIRFPRWPDIILDLSDIRLGLRISIPDFDFQLNRIRLPRLPDLSLPSAPNLSIRLPALPVLPALPDLPDLPDLPTIPTIVLPNLPPPPKLPKLSGAIQAMLRILRLIAKMYCYYQNTMLIPEWQVGDVIAQRTERQGVLPMDFLNVHFPDITIPSIKEIRIATHVNLELQSDFLIEFAEALARPINQFTNDIQSLIPDQIGDDVRVPSPLPGGTIPIDIPTPWNGAIPELSKAIAALMEQNNTLMDTQEFYEYFRAELSASDVHAGHAESLDRMMMLARNNADALQSSLLEYHSKKFQALYEVLEYEKQKTGELQKVIDTLREDTTQSLLAHEEVLPFVMDRSISDGHISVFYDVQKQENIPESLLFDHLDHDIQKAWTSVGHRARRLANATIQPIGTPPPPPINNPYRTSASYMPRFEGIYIITSPSGIQTKLFDYTQPVRADTRVDTIDIDQDGDKDYIFLLDGALFVKQNFTHNPARTENLAPPKIVSIGGGSPFPVAPNFFHESIVTPQSINLSFRPASPEDTAWRLEFFDGYLEWDRLTIGGAPSRPRIVMDFMAESPASTSQALPNGYTMEPVARSITRWANDPSFRLESWNLTVLTGEIYISLSPGRALYTGMQAVDISVKNEYSEAAQTIRLEPYTKYVFDTTTEISARNGPLFLIETDRSNHITTGSDDLVGMPVLPGMRFVSEWAVKVRDHIKNTDIDLVPGTEYGIYSLGQQSDQYHMRIAYPHGWYYARLHTLSASRHDATGIALFAPQASADRSNPVITLSEHLRIPVYAVRDFSLSEIITEMSEYTAMIDENIVRDDNQNGNPNDDFVQSGQEVRIVDDVLRVGAFDEPGRRSMLLKVRDEFGNTSYLPLQIEIYTPIPSLIRMDEAWVLQGTLSEPLADEPIHIWNIRHNYRPLLLHTGGFMTDSAGNFSTDAFIDHNPESISISASGNTWNILSGWALSALPTGYTLTVTGASHYAPMTLSVYDALHHMVYEQWVILPQYTQFFSGSDIGTQTGVWLDALSGYAFERARYNDPNIPGGYYFVGNDRMPLLLLPRDGNIWVIDPTISLHAENADWFLRIVFQKNGEILGSVLYRMNFFFVER